MNLSGNTRAVVQVNIELFNVNAGVGIFNHLFLSGRGMRIRRQNPYCIIDR